MRKNVIIRIHIYVRIIYLLQRRYHVSLPTSVHSSSSFSSSYCVCECIKRFPNDNITVVVFTLKADTYCVLCTALTFVRVVLCAFTEDWMIFDVKLNNTPVQKRRTVPAYGDVYWNWTYTCQQCSVHARREDVTNFTLVVYWYVPVELSNIFVMLYLMIKTDQNNTSTHIKYVYEILICIILTNESEVQFVRVLRPLCNNATWVIKILSTLV